MMIYKIAVFLLASFAAGLPVFAQEGPLESSLVAYVIDLDEEGEEILIESEDVAPGDLVEYHLSYENTGGGDLAGVIVTAPIPAATVFQLGTDLADTPSIFEASIDDGETWAVPPILLADGESEAPLEAYDLVRWNTESAIAAGDDWLFKYRVQVE